jgi:hypothetical protein
MSLFLAKWLFGAKWRFTSKLSGGVFYCPVCEVLSEYDLKQTQPYSVVLFVPVPAGDGVRSVHCKGCGRDFEEDVLAIGPPTAEQRLRAEEREQTAQLERRLEDGADLDSLIPQLDQMGYTPAGVEEFFHKACGGPPKQCACGVRYHPLAGMCPACGARL